MASYRLRLLSDVDLLSIAESVYNVDSLISKEHTLDSSRFGATITNPICQICRGSVETCPGHIAIIDTMFAIPKSMCLKDIKLVVEAICPICSRFLIPNINLALSLPPENRMGWIKRETERLKSSDSIVYCLSCKNKVPTIDVQINEPTIRFLLNLKFQNKVEQFNPTQIYVMLQNFTQLEEGGYNIHNHPKNFMTRFIPILPNRLRPKTIMFSESSITGHYRSIIEEMCVELSKIYKILSSTNNVTIDKGDIQNNFNKYYDKLMAYYLLITDTGSAKSKESEMSAINKRDRKHIDQIVSLIGRLRSKKTTIFARGLFASRHNVSCRTVLGGTIDGKIRMINVPFQIASKMSIFYKVYQQNLETMRQLVAAMSNPETYKDVTVPKVLGVWNCANGFFGKVNMKNAVAKAAILKAGDKLAITLLNGDWVLQTRFPSLREESWTAFQVNKNHSSIITIPPATCEMKSADFDGDEIQMYVPHSKITDVESILLQSVFRQMIGYKDGKLVIWYSADAPDGLKQIKRGLTTRILDDKYVDPPANVVEVLESYLPETLNYKDSKIHIRDGKFVGDNVDILNHDLHKFIYFNYGAEIVERFMSKCVNLAYDINRNRGNTIGFEVSINKPETRIRIEKLKNETYQQLCEIEQSKSPYKFLLGKTLVEKQKMVIGEILADDLKDTNLGKSNYTKTRLDELYNMIVLMDYTVVDTGRIEPVLAEGSRMTCAHPRHSLDPISRGYNHKSYANDIPAYSHFIDCISSRRLLYQKGVGTGVQGYMGKRVGIGFGGSWINHIGQVIDGHRLISTQFGNCGLDSRRNVIQRLTDIEMDIDEFSEKYKLDDELIKLRKRINEYEIRYNQLTNFTASKKVGKHFISGYHFDQYINTIINKEH